MNEHAKAWVEDLRSGDFEQGTCALRVGNTYCCLGVLAVRYNKETGKGKWVERPETVNPNTQKPYTPMDFIINDDDEPNSGWLPKEIVEWVGLNDRHGNYEDAELRPGSDHKYPYTTSLAHRNDNGKSLKEIADIIASNPEGLFVKD